MADPLVSCAWLAERLDAPDIRIIDATWFMPSDPRDAAALYGERRIPGALFFPIDEIAAPDTELPHMLPSPELFAARMRKVGVSDGARVVVYDSVGVFSAPRVWWTFRAMGHQDVVVLDGGLPAWEAGGYPIEHGPPRARQERHFTVQFRADLVRDLADMRRAVETGATILDARSEARFTGAAPEPRPGLRGGHMPGALNVPFSSLLTPDGFMKPVHELRAIFAGLPAASAPICTCGSGMTAGIVALALARIGRWDAPIYDGSWTEWGGRDDTPIVSSAG